jgi:acetyl esterase/lipase
LRVSSSCDKRHEASDISLLTIPGLLKIPHDKHIDPWNFPIWANNLEVMPPTYLIGAGCDPFADDVLLYSELLTKAGVPNKAKVYEV